MNMTTYAEICRIQPSDAVIVWAQALGELIVPCPYMAGCWYQVPWNIDDGVTASHIHSR